MKTKEKHLFTFKPFDLNSKTFSDKELRALSYRWQLTTQSCWNYGRMQGCGYLTTMLPVIEKLYGDDEEARLRALKVHSQFFNTETRPANIIIGIDVAMEEKDGIESIDAVAAVKASLMGPFAGVGDTIFSVILGTIFGSIAASMAVEGSYLGLIPSYIFAWWHILWAMPEVLKMSYNKGLDLIESINDKLKAFTDAASVLGLIDVGAMIASMVMPGIGIGDIAVGQLTMNVQTQILDPIMPNLLPIILVSFCYWLMRKRKLSSTWIIWIVLVLAIIGAYFNIFTIA